MGRIYRLSEDSAVVIDMLKQGQIPGLQHRHQPIDDMGNGITKPSLWPDGVSDGKSAGWFEDDMVLFWGSNDETPILNALKKAGIGYRYIG